MQFSPVASCSVFVAVEFLVSLVCSYLFSLLIEELQLVSYSHRLIEFSFSKKQDN